mmetsp:Transcript_16588/g.30002  ORF Transcript_16588/g.30002 Transcript_16588/m.30002 type:complete len:91 (+) Transcript_16588:115-387(+)
MGNVCEEAITKTTSITTPKCSERNFEIAFGVINLFFFGIGTIIAGFMANDLADVLIGCCQLLVPFVGWLWSIVWGVLMIVGRGTTDASSS